MWSWFQQTRIAIRVEAVSRVDGMCIGAAYAFPACKCADQHEQRRAWQVEVGQKQINRAEPVAWRDEERGVAGEWLHLPAFGGRGFQQPQACRADRDHTLRRVDGGGGFGGDLAAFG